MAKITKTVLGDTCDLYWCNKCGGWSEMYYDHKCVDCGENATYIRFGECKSDTKAIPQPDYTPQLTRIADTLECIAGLLDSAERAAITEEERAVEEESHPTGLINTTNKYTKCPHCGWEVGPHERHKCSHA